MDFNERIRREGTRSEKWDGLEKVFGQADALPLWVADMDFPCPPEVTEALVERARHGVFGYTMWTDSYYRAASQWLLRRHGWQVEPDSFLSSAGVVNGMSISLQALTRPGDVVVINTPVYGPFFGIPRMNGRVLRESPLVETPEGWRMDFEDLDRQLAGASLYMLCSPHNPVGRVWTEEELDRVVALCEKHGVLIFSDEIHGDLILSGHRHIPLASRPGAADRTVTFLAPSKTFNLAGLSASLIQTDNPDYRRAIREEFSRAGMHMGNTFGIEALEVAYRQGEPWLQEMLSYLEGNFDYVLSFLREHLPQIRADRPEGTYLLWLDFRGLGLDDRALQQVLLKKCRLALSAGSFFGEDGRGFMRMNLACPRSVLEEAMKRLKEGLQDVGTEN